MASASPLEAMIRRCRCGRQSDYIRFGCQCHSQVLSTNSLSAHSMNSTSFFCGCVLRNWKSRPIATSCWGVPCLKKRWFRHEPIPQWRTKFLSAKAIFGQGFVGLNLQQSRQGNRLPCLGQSVEQLLEQNIGEVSISHTLRHKNCSKGCMLILASRAYRCGLLAQSRVLRLLTIHTPKLFEDIKQYSPNVRMILYSA